MQHNPSFRIRPIEAPDNEAAKRIVQETLAEFGISGPGYACSDPELDDLHGYYQQTWGLCLVAEDTATGEVTGIGAVAQLKGTTKEEAVCELQKYYFVPAARGQGIGKRLLEQLLQEAPKLGFHTVYLESVPTMQPAITLYEKLGFQRIPEHKGNTGHAHNCPVWMALNVRPEKAGISKAG